MVDRKSKLILVVFLLFLIFSISAIYYRSMVSQDYEVYWYDYDAELEAEEEPYLQDEPEEES